MNSKGYVYVIDHIPEATPHNRRPGLLLSPKYITVHSTANTGSTARNESDWLTNPSNDRTASWHICVDEHEAVEAIPLNEVAWHAGDGTGGPGNRGSIAVEICESGDRAKTLANAAELIAELLHSLDLGVDRLRRHWDWSKKSCPRILMADNWTGWENLKGEIQKRLDIMENPLNPADSTAPADNTGDETLPRIQRRVEGTLDGRPADFEAYLINNITYIPLRSLAGILGLNLVWRDGKYHLLTGTHEKNG